MGDRASIQFRDDSGQFSAILNDHWGGMEFVNAARDWLKNYDGEGKYAMPVPRGVSTPQTRRDADALMVEFIRAGIGGDRVVCSTMRIDNSDNGHFVLNTADGSVWKHLKWQEESEI